MSEIGLRIITGAGLIALMIAGTVLSSSIFFIVFGLIELLCLLEYYKIVFSKNPKGAINIVRTIYGTALAMLPFIGMAMYLSGELWVAQPAFVGIFIIAFFLLMIFELLIQSPNPVNNVVYTGFSVIYIGFSFMMLAYLQSLYGAPIFILGIIMLIFMNDSLAYVVGRWKGKTPLFPAISPKKTWEGAIGGSIFTFGLALTYPIFFFKNMPFLWDWFIIAAIVVIMGPIGDLTESMLKRTFNFKDSGSLLPGHGGFFDRFDAFIFVIPFVTIYYILAHGV